MPFMQSQDFRDRAVEASDRAVRAANLRPGVDATQAGISYCLRREQSAQALRRILQVQTLMMTGLGFLLGIAAVAAFVVGQTPWRFSGITLIGAGCAILGIGHLAIAAVLEPRTTALLLRRRLKDAWPGDGRMLRLENAATYNKLKIIADDGGVVVAHPQSGCVQIEGLSHRYLIYAADITELTILRREAPEAFNLTYLAGGEPLQLTIIPWQNGLYAEFTAMRAGSNAAG
jgi:MFS family permease